MFHPGVSGKIPGLVTDADPQIDLSFAPDKPGLMARRILYRLAQKEHPSHSAHPVDGRPELADTAAAPYG